MADMTMTPGDVAGPRLLPLLDARPPERRDAARNRVALLDAAERLIEHCGIDKVTMDAVAEAAGVGKGTVFRRFESREGLMGALLNHSETEWQAAVHLRSPAARPGRRAVGAAARLRTLRASRRRSSTPT